MKTIDVTDETFARLAKFARPFEDTTPEAVIIRLLQVCGEAAAAAEQPEPADASPIRIPRGETTPDRVFYPWIVKVLQDFGGAAEKSAVTKQIGEHFQKRLTKKDKELVSTGETRWENRVAWGRHHLKELGIIDSNSAWGVWKLTDKGMLVGRSGDWPEGWPDLFI